MMRERLHFAVCDDEPEALEQICESLRNTLQKLEYRESYTVSGFASGTELYEATKRKHFHLILLDIEMPEPDGFQLAEKLYLTASESCLVFVSCHEDFVFDSFVYAPLAFVRKSALEKDLHRTMEQYFQKTLHLQVSIRLKDGFDDKELLIRDILYVECEGHHLTYMTVHGLCLKAYGTLKAVEEVLAEHDFLRVHRSYLVNQRYVETVGRREVVLAGGRSIDMGKERRKEVRAAMLQFDKKRGKNGV